MSWTIITHLAYLALAVPLTVWVAATLARNGRVFLAEVFTEDGGMAGAVNRLLVVGFCLVNVGFVLLYLRAGGPVEDLDGFVETISVKLGLVMLLTGIVHLANVLVFNGMRHRSRAEARRATGFGPHPFPVPQYVPYPAAPAPGDPAARG